MNDVTSRGWPRDQARQIAGLPPIDGGAGGGGPTPPFPFRDGHGGAHVGELSNESFQLIGRTGQPQQIRENLVLGTAAANTAMLSWETAVKQTMRQNAGLKLSLVVFAVKEDRQVTNQRGTTVTIPVATSIKYHFAFKTSDRATAPIVLEFNTQSHAKPPMSEYGEVLAMLDRVVTQELAVATPMPHGIRTDTMHAV